ncbi:MAG: InlB B-repeat-containing protein, partial [Bacteroidales bacterium]|nr:InlB B-repeat-containing protein [Bacteroidales bacterium]
MKNFVRLFVILWVCLQFIVNAKADELTVYDGTATSTTIPMYGLYFDDYAKSECIIPADQLTQMVGGTITSMTFYVSSASTGAWDNTNQKVFLKEVGATTLGGSYSGIEGATIVFDGQLTLPTSTGEYTIVFSQNYTYNGGNLLIGVYNDDDGTYHGISWYGVSGLSSGVSAYGYNSSSLSSATYNAQTFLPKTTFTYTSTSTNCGTEDFAGYTAVSFTSSDGVVPSEWHSYSSNASGYVPRVSNYSNYSYINGITSNTDNYLLMTATTTYQYSYAIMPMYSNITSASFKYRYENTSNGTLTVGYVTNNSGYATYTVLGTPTKTTDWTTYPLSASDIETINNNSGYITFRYEGSNSITYGVAIDDVEVCTNPSTPTTYTVSYNSNGGSGTMTDSNSPYTSGSTVTVMNNGFTAPSGKEFAGWNTAADGSATSYSAGATFSITANTTLYAQWVALCADCTTITFSDLGYADQTNVNSIPIAICSDISVTFNTASGSYDPKYYTSGTALRVYAGNTFIVSTTGSDPITSINITFGSSDGTSEITANTGFYSNGSWTGSAASVTFSLANSGTNRRIVSIEVCTTTSSASDPDCTPSFSSGSDYIANFTLGSINNTTGFTAGGYGDYTSMSTNVEQGSVVTAYLTSVDDGIGDHSVVVWIDFNDNGEFEDSERVGGTSVANNSTVSFVLAIPVDAPLGSHLMRVLFRYGTSDYTTITPCVGAAYGEGEDYVINITSTQETPPCTPSFSSGTDYIANFSLGSINNTTGFTDGGYANYTGMSTDLERGAAVSASLTSSSGSGTHAAAVWIDFNDNGLFDASERVGTRGSISESSTVSIALAIPGDAPLGSHTLRVVYQYNVSATDIDPCASATFGEAEDYTVNITSGYDCSASTLSIGMNSVDIDGNGRYYYNVCVGGSVPLTGVLQSGTATSWRWYINPHNGNPSTYTTQSVPYTPLIENGHDITLTARDEHGCPAYAYGRIRVSDGLTVPAQISPAESGVCQGSERIITIGSGAGSEIQVADESYEITATLGESNLTFIPDGPNCDVQCYESPVTFNDFSDGATIRNADDINYIMINMEHSHISDMQIKIVCPNGRSSIILPDLFSTSDYPPGLDDYTYTWPYRHLTWNGRDWNYAPIGFGVPSRDDNVDYPCNASLQTNGTGWDYCWSNNTAYSYAGGTYGYVYETANHQDGEGAYKIVKPSNMSNMTQIYHPVESFANLVGCPLNGTWKISVCDSWKEDNGYIFSWEISLSEDFFPDPWSYDVYVASTEVTPSNYGDDVSSGSGAAIVIHPPSDATGNQHVNVTVIDNLGCRTESPIEVDFAVTQTYDATISGNLHVCSGSSTTLTAGTDGGVSPFTYSWNTTETTGSISPTNITSNTTYNVEVVDASGCTGTAATSVFISNPTVSMSSTAVNCRGGNDGMATATITNANSVGPYTYRWSNGTTNSNVNSTTNTITVTAGTYRVTVTDAGGCTATGSVTVSQPSSAVTASLSAGTIGCNGGTTNITNTVSGGTASYSYHWNNNATTQNLSNVGAGSYSVTVTDAHTCTATASVTISQPTALTASLSAGTIGCNGGTTNITNTVSGGTANYSYHWNNNATTQNLSNVGAG